MKKVLSIFLGICLLFQCFSFALPVSAVSITDAKLKIVSIKQGNKDLTIRNGKYVINSYENVILTYEIENYDKNNNYVIKEYSYNNEGSTGYTQTYYGRNSVELDINNNYKYTICDNHNCDNEYDTISIDFDNELFENINQSYIYIESINQGKKRITPNSELDYSKTAHFNFNNIEKITYKVKGVNLQPDAYYNLIVDMSNNYDIGTNILGSDLNDGYEFSYYPTITTPIRFLLKRDNYKIGYLLYNINGEYWDIYNIYSDADNTVSNFDFNLSYTNYKNVAIKEKIENYTNTYLVSSKYHNRNNTLTMNILGNENFQNQNYDIRIEGYSNNIKTYDKTFNKNGKDIAKGLNIELENYLLSYITEYEKYDTNNRVVVTIGDVLKEINLYYSSLDKIPYINANIYFENGKKNLSTFRGNGGINWIGGIADTNKTAFTKYSSMFFNFTGNDFVDNEIYDYTFEYGSFIDGNFSTNAIYNYNKVLDRGKVYGRLLNTIGMNFKVDNKENYKMPTYRFTIKKGDEIIYYQAPVLSLVNSPTLANVSMTSNNKNLYLQTNDMSYIATRNHPINIVISGLGFQENKDYDFDYCYYFDDSVEQVCKKLKINGKDLNNGTGSAKLTFDQKIPSNVSNIDFYAYSEAAIDQYQENVAIQGGFNVKLVDSKDFFPTISKYILDNEGDFIKNISKLTSVKDFTSTLDVSNNGKLKIFDHTGEKEIKDTIGTGMIARIVNEYEENVLDLDVVVKGDVSGDGNISITDLVKVKRHLSQDQALNGVYEVAGNVTDSGKISITDLVKISRDVASIQEVE